MAKAELPESVVEHPGVMKRWRRTGPDGSSYRGVGRGSKDMMFTASLVLKADS